MLNFLVKTLNFTLAKISTYTDIVGKEGLTGC